MTNCLEPKNIVFISGKGGSGKTTLTIAMARLLASMGIPCLLIDFDFATHGCSYFFSERLSESGTDGIWELLSQYENWAINNPVNTLPILIEENFYFISSRSRRKGPGETYDATAINLKYLQKGILEPLVHWASDNEIQYIIIDCQAGYSIATQAAVFALEPALLIMVLEPDIISNDASESLLFQLSYYSEQQGKSLPLRRTLTNMLEVQELELYDDMGKREEFFRLNNQLPPIPFDFSVRKAFAKRELTLNPNEPSPFLFALIKSLKKMIPELSESIELYEKRKVDSLFVKYEKEIEKLRSQKEDIERELFEIKDYNRQSRKRYQKELLNYFFILMLLIVARQLMLIFSESNQLPISPIGINTVFWMLIAFLCLSLYVSTSRLLSRLARGAEGDDDRVRKLFRQLDRIDTDLDSYRSLTLALSRELFIDQDLFNEK